MKTVFLKLLLSYFLLHSTCYLSSAQEIIAGEISYKHISDLTYSIELNTISKYLPVDSILLYFGDGQADYQHTSIQDLQNETFKNNYTFTHTFAGPGEFILSAECGLMEAGLENVFNSVHTPFLLTCTFVIMDPLFLGSNSSPVSLSILNQYYSVDNIYHSNFNYYDLDGDVLKFKFINGQLYPPYYPTIELPEATKEISIDSSTGDFIWNSPVEYGRYLFLFSIEEYRNNYRIGNTICSFTIDHFTEENTILLLYPNPSYSELILDFQQNIFTNYQIAIYNSAGQVAIRLDKSDKTPEVLLIDIEELPSSMYFLQFKSAEAEKTFKFIKTSKNL